MIAGTVASLNRHLVVAVLLLALASALWAAPGDVRISSMNFVDAEIATVVKSLADVSGANIVVSPDVKGTVTLKLRDVTVDQALDIVSSMSGFSYRLEKGIYIVSKGVKMPALKNVAPEDRTVIRLKVLQASDALSALGVAFPDIKGKELMGNALVLSGDMLRLEDAKSFLDEIDVPLNSMGSTALDLDEQVYEVKSIVPEQAKQYIEDLYQGNGLTVSYMPNQAWLKNLMMLEDVKKKAQTETKEKVKGNDSDAGSAQASIGVEGDYTSAALAAAGMSDSSSESERSTTRSEIEITKLEWKSSTLILRGPTTVVADAVRSLQTIDKERLLAQTRCKVNNIYPTQAISILLVQYESRGLMVVTEPMTFAGGKPEDASSGRVNRDPKTGKLNITEPVGDFYLVGTKEVVDEAVSTLAKIDVGPTRVTRVHTVRFIRVDEAKKNLLELYGGKGLQVMEGMANRGTMGKISNADDVNNDKIASADESKISVFDLVLSGPENVVDEAEALLTQIDRESLQISIKAKIVSLDSNASRALGVEWPGTISTTFTENQSGEALTLGRITRSPISIDATLNMLETQNKAKLISQPATVVQNGREALIHVGDKVMYEILTGYSNGNPVFSTDTLDVGVTLKVLPQASNDGVITLQITTSVSELLGFNKGASGAELPQSRATESSNVVTLKSGQTLFIGGLTQSGLITEKKGVPGLGNIPLIGYFFSSKTTKPLNKEMVIMVTPEIISSFVNCAPTPDVSSIPNPAAAAAVEK